MSEFAAEPTGHPGPCGPGCDGCDGSGWVRKDYWPKPCHHALERAKNLRAAAALAAREPVEGRDFQRMPESDLQAALRASVGAAERKRGERRG